MYLSLAPPAQVVDSSGHIGADTVAVALYAIEGDVVLIKRRRIGAVELCVDVRGILGVTRQRLSDLSPLNSAIVEIAGFRRHPARLRTGISKQLKGRLKLKQIGIEVTRANCVHPGQKKSPRGGSTEGGSAPIDEKN